MNRYLRHAMATLAVIAAAALIPSAAVARTDPPSSPVNSQASPATKQAQVVSYGYPVTSTSTSDDGFQWGDAALGAGIVAALGLAGFGIAVLYRHRRSLSAAEAPAAIS